ncbi:ABC transporter ATP-binding protein/permease [Gammaproteobacteria bacterium]|nr:ABC transporter ATP-binding protein/permease [Gammaproteobacteria bacterium]
MLGVCYLSIAFIVRRKLVKTSKVISSNQIKTIKVLQESLDGIKEIILGNYYDKFIDEFSSAERPYRRGYGTNAFLIIFPRFLIEAVGILVIVSLAYLSFSSAEDPSSTLPTIGILVLAIQRLLPYLQQIYQAYGGIKGSAQLNTEAIDMLIKGHEDNQVLKEEASNIEFQESIKLSQVHFKYSSEEEMTLKNISLKINKGERVGIIGSTGSGKSTLVDFLMGLLPFKEGEILIDGIPLKKSSLLSWYKKILHVPQTIFLADTTIKNNIAFGEREGKISEDRVKASIKSAYLEDYINTLPKGIETKVGERGFQLSGGQRQRIGIARSLYKGGEIFVLDEATNSLDMETEKNIIKTINSLDRKITLIIIAHNLSTIEGCDRLIVIENGQILAQGDYQTISQSNEFKRISGELLD